jgi:hypothetical protein
VSGPARETVGLSFYRVPLAANRMAFRRPTFLRTQDLVGFFPHHQDTILTVKDVEK